MDVPSIVDCVGAIPFPASGIASGNTTNQPAVYEGECFPQGGRDAVYALTLPGRTRSLVIRATNPDFTLLPALHVYRETCLAADRVGCAGTSIDGDFAELVLTDLEAGDYAIVVDGNDSATRGPFVLTVQGQIAAGEPCDPNLSYATCEVGGCRAEGAGFACPQIFDCDDGIDADGDGAVDEDVCVDPPAVTCPADAAVLPGVIANLTATPMDTGGVTARRWSILERPTGSRAEPQPNDQDTSFLRVDLIGSYRARYVAYDTAFETGACEVTLSATTADDLVVEAYWLDEPLDGFDLDLVLIHPTSPNWADLDLSCSFENSCEVDWGEVGPVNDPRWGGDAPTEVTAENIRVPNGELAGNYGVGVSSFTGTPRRVHVNLYCDGVFQRSFGPMILAEGLFWKVADVQLAQDGCTITVLNSVVPRSQAEIER